MSFHEKSAIAMLAILAIVYGGYFQSAFELHQTGVTTMRESGSGMIGAVIGIIVLSILFHTVIAVFSPKEEAKTLELKDERDKLINIRSDAHSSWILGFGIFAAIAMTFFEKSYFLIGHVLLASLVVTEMIKYLFVIYHYRRGI